MLRHHEKQGIYDSPDFQSPPKNIEYMSTYHSDLYLPDFVGHKDEQLEMDIAWKN